MTDLDFEYEEAHRKQPSLDEVIEALQANQERIPGSTLLYGLSSLDTTQIAYIQPVWAALNREYRRRIIQALVEVNESNFDLDYENFAWMGLDDPDVIVRKNAIELFWENQTFNLLDRLMVIATDDPSEIVRAEAAKALGRFIYLGEMGDLPEDKFAQAQKTVIGLLQDPKQDVEVRRRALEAIANCSNSIVAGAVREAYESDEYGMRISAVFAMGRTCDNRWNDMVLKELENGDSEMRFEAARASGELTIQEAVPQLIRVAYEDEREIQEMAIWSLGEIGSREAVRALNRLMDLAIEDGDDTLTDALEEALDNASFGAGGFLLFDFDEEED